MNIPHHPPSGGVTPTPGPSDSPYGLWLAIAGVFLIAGAVLPRGMHDLASWWGPERIDSSFYAWIWDPPPAGEPLSLTLWFRAQLGLGILALWAGRQAARRTQAWVIVLIPCVILAVEGYFYGVHGDWGFPPLDATLRLRGGDGGSGNWLRLLPTPGVLLVLLGAWRRSRVRCVAGGVLLSVYLCWPAASGDLGIVQFVYSDFIDTFEAIPHLAILDGISFGFAAGFALLGLSAVLPGRWRILRPVVLFASRAAVVVWVLESAIAAAVDAHVADRTDLLVPWISKWCSVALPGTTLLILLACAHGLAYDRWAESRGRAALRGAPEIFE